MCAQRTSDRALSQSRFTHIFQSFAAALTEPDSSLLRVTAPQQCGSLSFSP